MGRRQASTATTQSWRHTSTTCTLQKCDLPHVGPTLNTSSQSGKTNTSISTNQPVTRQRPANRTPGPCWSTARATRDKNPCTSNRAPSTHCRWPNVAVWMKTVGALARGGRAGASSQSVGLWRQPILNLLPKHAGTRRGSLMCAR